MKNYWYNTETKLLHTDKQMKSPFLCPAECIPLKFENASDCLNFLKEQKFEGSVLYKLKQR